MLKTEIVLDIPITSSPKEEILEYIITGLQEKSKKLFIVTPNPEMLVASHKKPSLKTLLKTADVSLPDGMGVVWASKILHKSVQNRVSGVDLMVDLCQECAKRGLTVGFLGGWENVAERTANCLKKKLPELNVGFVGEEWDEDKFKIQNSKFKIEGIDILFVAFGFPKQEQWIHDNLDKIPVTAAMGVGGAFDYISGNVRRAPKWVQNIGLEWLFRLVRQPWRLRRQLALVEFIFLVLRARTKSQ